MNTIIEFIINYCDWITGVICIVAFLLVLKYIVKSANKINDDINQSYY